MPILTVTIMILYVLFNLAIITPEHKPKVEKPPIVRLVIKPRKEKIKYEVPKHSINIISTYGK